MLIRRLVYNLMQKKSHYQNTGQNCNISIINKSFKNVVKYKYVERRVTNQNYIHDEIKK
jgi:hypothetical protein